MEWTNILKTVAPWIGTALGTPLAGMAISAAASALGASDQTADGIKQALSGATPEQMLALKKADQDFQVTMTQMGYKNLSDLEAIAAADRKDARDMFKTTRSLVPAFLSIVVTVGYFAILILMMAGKLHVSDSQALLLMLGQLGTGWGLVLAFWFGTTHDSGRKTEMIAQTNKS